MAYQLRVKKNRLAIPSKYVVSVTDLPAADGKDCCGGVGPPPPAEFCGLDVGNMCTGVAESGTGLPPLQNPQIRQEIASLVLPPGSTSTAMKCTTNISGGEECGTKGTVGAYGVGIKLKKKRLVLRRAALGPAECVRVPCCPELIVDPEPTVACVTKDGSVTVPSSLYVTFEGLAGTNTTPSVIVGHYDTKLAEYVPCGPFDDFVGAYDITVGFPFNDPPAYPTTKGAFIMGFEDFRNKSYQLSYLGKFDAIAQYLSGSGVTVRPCHVYALSDSIALPENVQTIDDGKSITVAKSLPLWDFGGDVNWANTAVWKNPDNSLTVDPFAVISSDSKAVSRWWLSPAEHPFQIPCELGMLKEIDWSGSNAMYIAEDFIQAHEGYEVVSGAEGNFGYGTWIRDSGPPTVRVMPHRYSTKLYRQIVAWIWDDGEDCGCMQIHATTYLVRNCEYLTNEPEVTAPTITFTNNMFAIARSTFAGGLTINTAGGKLYASTDDTCGWVYQSIAPGAKMTVSE